MSFEIRDPAIDSARLAERIRQDVAGRRARAAELGIDFEAIAGLRTEDGLENALDVMRLSYALIQVPLELAGAPARPWRHPLRWLKRQTHLLALYYVNVLGYRQGVFNSAAVRLIELLLAEQRAELARLQAQVDDLREQLAAVQQARQ
jgi:hypothetical protein